MISLQVPVEPGISKQQLFEVIALEVVEVAGHQAASRSWMLSVSVAPRMSEVLSG